ncbi:MAG: hypothetical protein SF066_02900 [Thermoanaerobaculia bacterium]|nr:hypothetical protein [Thermoanaerobaculia bacterium]
MRRPASDSSPAVQISPPFALHRLLWRFKNPQDAAAVVRVLEMVSELQNETFQWGPEDNDLTLLTCETAAAGADLRAVVDHLREIAEHREASGLDIEDWRLADKAAGWAEELGRIAAEIAEATTEPESET